jgi:hypothetical protein
VTEHNWRDAVEKRPGFAISESPSYVARGIAALAQAADTDGSKPDCWGHLAKYGWDHAGGGGIDEFR